MKPIVTKGTNSIFGDENYPRLPSQVYMENIDGEGFVCTQVVWELSDDEIEYLKETKKIYLSMIGDKPNPISLDVIPFVEE